MKYDWIRRLSLEQKVSLLCGKNFWDSRGIPGYDIPSICFSDGPHGLRRQNGDADNLGISQSLPATCFPTASALACSWDPQMAYEIGNSLGEEARWQKADVLLGPGLNVMRHPYGGRNFEYFSEDPWLCGIMGSAQSQGIQNYVQACLKHFLLNSQEKRRMCMDEVASDTLIREIYAMPFEMAIRQNSAWWVMSAYNKVNGIYASENPFLYGLLRNDWRFAGAVVSDWGGCHDLCDSVRAGQNLEMPSTFSQSIQELRDAVEEGKISEDILDERIREMIPVWNQVLENRRTPLSDPHLEEHALQAEEAAAKCMVLLEDDDHLLPLAADSRLLLVGPFAQGYPFQGDGSSRVNPTVQPDLAQALQKAGFQRWTCAKGYALSDADASNAQLLDEAWLAAADCDAIVFLLSLDPSQNIEGADRTRGSFPAHQKTVLQRLQSTGRPIIIIDAAAGAMELPVLEGLHAQICAGLAGQGSLNALFSLLSGKREFSGHLAVTFPWKLSARLQSGLFPSAGPQAIYTEEAFTGYRQTWNTPEAVRFAFGHGVTPARLQIRKARLEKDGVRFLACNTSDRPGCVLVQMYREWKHPGKGRAPAELRGFLRLELEAEEERECFLPFDEYTFRAWDAVQGCWVTTRKDASILLGPDALHIQARLPLQADEDDPQLPAAMPSVPAVHQKEYIHNEDMPLELADQSDSFVVRRLVQMLQRRRARGFQNGKPDLIAMAILDMPLRALAKNSGNLVSSKMAAAASAYISSPSVRHAAAFFRAMTEHLQKSSAYRKEHRS